uniref:GATOR complex protein NPRL3 n=1 Tax=Schistocephalus solidus TaxID=70667 RepID=A0A0X3Q7Y9_SCHSO
MAVMTSLNSSIVFWNEMEIIPRSILLISSGAGGDRLLFWHPLVASHPNNSQKTFAASTTVEREQTRPKSNSETVGATQRLKQAPETFPAASYLQPSANMANKVFIGVAFSLSRTAIGLDNLDPVDGEEIPTPLSPQTPHFRPFAASTPFSIASSPLSIMDFLGKPREEEEGEDDPTSAPTDRTQTSPGSTGGTNEALLTTAAATTTASSRFSQHKINQTLTSFAIVFAISDAAPPCVLSHYTELARITGVQLRRAELFWQYLSTERDRVITLLDSQVGIASTAGEVSAGGGGNSGIGGLGGGGGGGGTGGVGVNGATVGVAPCVKEEDRGEGVATTATESASAPELAADNESGPSSGSCGGPEALAGQAFALVAKRSPLCAELQQIVESVTSVGRVNIAIKGRYPVFFCLPYKAYAILPVGQPHLMPNWPALRPRAVWQAMEKMRPYHTLLLTTPKEELLASFLPPDANRSLASFIKELSPTVGLNDLSVGMHSQGHCLRLALWLVYNGHAIIAYPVAGNNSYTLAPLSHLWLNPQLLLEFAERFPHLNLAQVLSSFADFQTLKSHLSVDTDYDQRCSTTGACFWETIDLAETVELISWLLRRRLIIQLHTYVMPVLPAGGTTSLTPDACLETIALNGQQADDESREASEVANHTEDANGEHRERSVVVVVAEENHAQQQQQYSIDMTKQFFAELPAECTESLLQEALPNLADRHAVMTHYRNSVRDPTLLRLFLRILSQLPAHLEDLIFVESVDRETLILCIENFSQFLTTIRLPDPVTACFAGIEWPT